MRLTRFVGGRDLTVNNYLYHFNDTPVLFRTLTPGPQPKITVTPRYKRSHLFGGTFSNAFGDAVLRGEPGYSTGRYFLSDNINDNDGVIKMMNFLMCSGWTGRASTIPLSVRNCFKAG
ncbi:MAG: hypothetical protein GXP18_13025 [Gammaproteobacteria bacterium]|nr:hypothetical protein [Gammaproteobacteria bacterium]